MATMVAGGPDRDSLHSGKWEKKKEIALGLNLSSFKIIWMISHIKNFLRMYTNEGADQQREDNTGEKQEAGSNLPLLNALSTVPLEWNVTEKEVRLGGMTGRVGWALFSAVMTGVTYCNHLQGVSGVNKLAQWRNTHQTERKDLFFLPSYCQSVEISTIQQEGERRNGRKKQKEMFWLSDLRQHSNISGKANIIYRNVLVCTYVAPLFIASGTVTVLL